MLLPLPSGTWKVVLSRLAFAVQSLPPEESVWTCFDSSEPLKGSGVEEGALGAERVQDLVNQEGLRSLVPAGVHIETVNCEVDLNSATV